MEKLTKKIYLLLQLVKLVFFSNRPYTDALKRVAEGDGGDDDDDDVRPLSAMFRLGQLVVCSVVDIEKRTTVFFYFCLLKVSPR